MKYPPGEALTGIDSSTKDLLNSQQLKKSDKNNFKHSPSHLNNKQEKLQQFIKIIVGYAEVSNDCRTDFEDLIINTCIALSVMVKTGLKLNPSKPNDKSLLRIQQKMLFKSAKYIPPLSSSLTEVYEKEEKAYFTFLTSLLDKKQEVNFEISDMVRGKCTFTDIKDIIDTISLIKQQAAKYP